MTVHMMVGLPGSGKSTLRARLLNKEAPGAVVCCPDDILTINGKYVWTQEKCANAWSECYRVYEKALAENKDVIWDATFVNHHSRKEILRRARKFNASVVCWWLKVPYLTCAARNAKRSEDRRVPEDVMKRMSSKEEAPTYDEGFKDIHILASAKGDY